MSEKSRASEIITFVNERFGNVRSVFIDDKPWFVAADVCRCLGIKQTTRSVENLDEDEKGMSHIHTLGGDQSMLVINESGLYHLIFNSRKPIATKFRRWVTDEIIPSLRQNGVYVSDPKKAAEYLAPMLGMSVEDTRNALNTLYSGGIERFNKAYSLLENREAGNAKIKARGKEKREGPINERQAIVLMAHKLRPYLGRGTSQKYAINYVLKVIAQNLGINFDERSARWMERCTLEPKRMDLIWKSELPAAVNVVADACRIKGCDVSDIVSRIEGETEASK